MGNPVIMVDPDGKDAVITINGTTITVSSQIYIYGEGASTSLASRIETAINSKWNGAGQTYTDEDGNVFDVVFNVTVSVYDSADPTNNPLVIPDAWNPESTNNYIKIKKGSGQSHVWAGDEDVWYDGASNWTYAHEFGHLVGLDDRYHDKYYVFGGPTVTDSGWETNIIGTYGGKIDQRNIDGIVGESVEKYGKFKSAWDHGYFDLAKGVDGRYKHKQVEHYSKTGEYKTKIDKAMPSK